MNKPISENTPITTALVVSLCAAAFWIGTTTSGLSHRVTNIEAQLEKSADVMQRLSTLSTQLELKINRIEKDRDRKQ